MAMLRGLLRERFGLEIRIDSELADVTVLRAMKPGGHYGFVFFRRSAQHFFMRRPTAFRTCTVLLVAKMLPTRPTP